MTIVSDSVLPPCANDPDVFLDAYLQSPPAHSELNAASRRLLRAKKAAAHRRCAGCSIFVECLYRSVVEVDISGYVACTTESDRTAIRRKLDVRVAKSETTQYGTPRIGGGPVNHEDVIAARQAHPHDTCQQLAERLGCSTSTIKRHLRRARQQVALDATDVPPERGLPSVEDVLDAFDELDIARVV